MPPGSLTGLVIETGYPDSDGLVLQTTTYAE